MERFIYLSIFDISEFDIMANSKKRKGYWIFAVVAVLIAVVLLFAGNEKPIEPKSLSMINVPPNGKIALSASEIDYSIGNKEYRLYSYNNLIPGPVYKVKQGSEIEVNFINNLNKETTIHWHGLRHDNENDGVPGITQEPVKPGNSFIYNLKFPDAGVWHKKRPE